jgi:hypothetical protein
VPTDLAATIAILYTGSDPIRTGVASGTIEPRRVTVLRGQVRARNGEPLPGVQVAVLGHPGRGRTRSRADGALDLAVNGGGRLTLTYARPRDSVQPCVGRLTRRPADVTANLGPGPCWGEN